MANRQFGSRGEEICKFSELFSQVRVRGQPLEKFLAAHLVLDVREELVGEHLDAPSLVPGHVVPA